MVLIITLVLAGLLLVGATSIWIGSKIEKESVKDKFQMFGFGCIALCFTVVLALASASNCSGQTD